jgi:hypothetical protein
VELTSQVRENRRGIRIISKASRMSAIQTRSREYGASEQSPNSYVHNSEKPPFWNSNTHHLDGQLLGHRLKSSCDNSSIANSEISTQTVRPAFSSTNMYLYRPAARIHPLWDNTGVPLINLCSRSAEATTNRARIRSESGRSNRT